MFETKVITNENEIDDLFSRYLDSVLPSKEKAVEMLKSGRKLSFYLGIDPTGPDIHLGHTTNLLFLKKLKHLGHRIILLIGDFTAKVGDPTGKESARKKLSEKEVEENMKTYLEQVYKILPEGSFDVDYNSRWWKKMSWDDGMELASNFTVQQMLVRDMFQKRVQEQKPIYLQEFMYPLMQGYDSVAMKVDGEVGGTDQTFNMLVGRDLERIILSKEKLVFTTKLLEDPKTCKKMMNKSEGQYISLNYSSKDMFGKIMAMSDSTILPLFENTTEVPETRIREIKSKIDEGENPKKFKEELALELVRMYHGDKEAQKALDEWEKVFSNKERPSEIEEAPGDGMKLVDFITEHALATSSSEAKRLLDQGSVSINEEVVKEWGHTLKKGDVIRVGPRKFLKVS